MLHSLGFGFESRLQAQPMIVRVIKVFLFRLSHSQVQSSPRTYRWSLKMCLVPLAASAVPPSRSASPRRRLLSRRKQVMLVTVIPIRIHPQHIIIIIYKQFTITHRIIFITISITIIFMPVISILPITIICITQTHTTAATTSTRTKFLIAVFLPLQVPAPVPTATWALSAPTSRRISPSCRARCRLHRPRASTGCPVRTRRCSSSQCSASSAHRKTLHSHTFSRRTRAVTTRTITTTSDRRITRWSCSASTWIRAPFC